MSTFEAKIDGQQVFFNVGADLDWFILADLDSSVCVVTIDDDGGEHQSLARKGDLSEIRVVVE